MTHELVLCFVSWYVYHRDRHVLTHSFPTRRSSDLLIGHQTISNMIGGHRATLLEAPHHAAHLSRAQRPSPRSEEHTSELQSLMRISYAVFCLKKKTTPPAITQLHRSK